MRAVFCGWGAGWVVGLVGGGSVDPRIHLRMVYIPTSILKPTTSTYKTNRYGNTVDYFTGLTAVASSPDGDSIYAVGTSVMPGVGGAWASMMGLCVVFGWMHVSAAPAGDWMPGPWGGGEGTATPIRVRPLDVLTYLRISGLTPHPTTVDRHHRPRPRQGLGRAERRAAVQDRSGTPARPPVPPTYAF